MHGGQAVSEIKSNAKASYEIKEVAFSMAGSDARPWLLAKWQKALFH